MEKPSTCSCSGPLGMCKQRVVLFSEDDGEIKCFGHFTGDIRKGNMAVLIGSKGSGINVYLWKIYFLKEDGRTWWKCGTGTLERHREEALSTNRQHACIGPLQNPTSIMPCNCDEILNRGKTRSRSRLHQKKNPLNNSSKPGNQSNKHQTEPNSNKSTVCYVCGNPECGTKFICGTKYNRIVKPEGYTGTHRC